MNRSQMKFLIDVGVGKSVENYLHENGFDIKAVRDIDPAMPDEKIIRIAVFEQRMIVTMDKDFGELVYHSFMDHCGVLLLRLEDATVIEKRKVMEFIIDNYLSRIQNCFCVFKNDKFRIRAIRNKKGN
ncbi:MAG: DUF5615 family PIN-like protein [Desulfamplus sp.]|nr:DUF5615 family PIN-like protein [Desulfamplus sp.]